MTINPIPILFTIPNFITAGSGQVLFNIVSRLDRGRFNPTVGVLRKGGNIEQQLESIGIPVLQLPFTIPVKPYRLLLIRAYKASLLFRNYNFKIWHSFHYSSDYTEPLIARLSGTHNWIYTKKNMDWRSRAWRLRSLLATRIIADNKDMPELFFRRYGLSKKTRVILHGIPLSQFSPKLEHKTTIREKYNISKNNKLIGCVAQLCPRKDQATLIKAIAEVKNCHLILAGVETVDGYLAELKNLVSTLGITARVHFLGQVADIAELMPQMDITVLPSREEAFGVVLIESMACGIPTITTDISGPRAIIEDGTSGFIFQPGNDKQLAKLIKMLAEDKCLRERIGLAGRFRVEEHFSIEREVQAHEAVYAELLGLNG